jgi:hypothetical protein
MRLIFLGAISSAFLSLGAFAQQAPETASKGNTGTYEAGSAKPYSTGPLPQIDTGPGLDVPGPNDATETVKAVPCSTSAQETDGSTTCVGIPDEKAKKDRK